MKNANQIDGWFSTDVMKEMLEDRHVQSVVSGRLIRGLATILDAQYAEGDIKIGLGGDGLMTLSPLGPFKLKKCRT